MELWLHENSRVTWDDKELIKHAICDSLYMRWHIVPIVHPTEPRITLGDELLGLLVGDYVNNVRRPILIGGWGEPSPWSQTQSSTAQRKQSQASRVFLPVFQM